MQHCLYNLCNISNWTFVAPVRMYEFLNVNKFGAELTRGWHISFHIYRQYNMHYTVWWNWREQFYSDEIRNSMLKYFLHPDQNLLHISLQIQYNLNLKIREDRNHCHHIFMKLTIWRAIVVSWERTSWQTSAAYASVAAFCSFRNCCKQKGLLEEMLNLFHNILMKN